MATLKLRAIGDSVGVVLPKDLLARLRVGDGDTLQVVETPNGFQLTPPSHPSCRSSSGWAVR